ncbi:hypothetical protein PT974_10213 [Cladobotryum mycophilum]|uniref:Fringe-like glycosyltransferase domain-containing protein n=1 Tax=Cladobotryum mycophilum TaxID=491253 RepID=A0ABR0S980_9HYPO
MTEGPRSLRVLAAVIMRSRPRIILVLILALFTLTIFKNVQNWIPLTPQIPNSTFRNKLSAAGKNCALGASHLADIKQRYVIEDKFDYFLRIVSFQRSKALVRKRITIVPQGLLGPNTRTIDLTKTYDGDAIGGDCSEPLQVEVPVSGLASTVNASDFMFGISTTYKRLNESRRDIIGDWEYWLTDGHGITNGAKLILMLLDASDNELDDARALLHDAGIDAHVDRSVDRAMPVRYVNLVPYLYRQEESRHRKWLVLCDDDTFFPSMHGLVEKLDTFDHSRELYIGTLSEDVGAIERHGSQAFGGAGVFLSMPMAKRITESISNCTSAEKVDEAGWQGDKLLRNCIYENSDTRLGLLPGLWQLDFRGDAAGFYEWGHKPLSLHHYRGGGWHHARPAEFSKIAYVCGEDCILQRFQTADNFIISGHSIAYYPAGITFDTSQVERTFEALWEKSWNFDFVFGPQRPSLKKEQKISWQIQGSQVLSGGSLLQTYLRKKDNVRWESAGNRQMGDRDSGVVAESLSRSLSRINISFEAWFSRKFKSILGQPVDFSDDEDSFRTFLLGLPRIEGHHSGENLADRVSEIIHEYGFKDREDCQAEKEIQDEVRLRKSKGHIEKLRNIVYWVQRSGQRIENLNKLQSIGNAALGAEDHTNYDVIRDNATRWNSSEAMMERGCQLQLALDSLVQAEVTEWNQHVSRRTQNGAKRLPKKAARSPQSLMTRGLQRGSIPVPPGV